MGPVPAPCARQASTRLSEGLECLDDLIERYRNSPIMHACVPDAIKPAVYQNGRRAPFLQPTKELELPRNKKANRKHRKRGITSIEHRIDRKHGALP